MTESAVKDEIEAKIYGNAEFQKTSEDVALKLRRSVSKGYTLIISHLDSDGLASAGILGRALARIGAQFAIRIVKQLDNDIIETLAAESGWQTLIFSDLGGGSLEAIANQMTGRNVFVLDHHLTERPVDLASEITYLNPLDFNLDPSLGISGAGVCYCVVRRWDPRNRDCGVIAVVGALGDRQDQGPDASLTGQNAGIAEEAIKWGYMSEDKSLWFFRGYSRDLITAIRGLRIPQLSEEPMVIHFLKEAGVESTFPRSESSATIRRRTLLDLSKEEKVRLLNALIIQYRVPYSEILRVVYTLEQEEKEELRDARQFSTILNSLGRQDREGLGVALAMGARGDILAEVQEMERQYSRELRKHVQVWSAPERVTDQYENLRAIVTRDSVPDQLIGTVTSMLANEPAFASKPLVGIAWSEGDFAKVSARLPADLSEMGTKANLSLILRQAVSEVCPENGEAGGHEAAAGAKIPRTKVEPFLEAINRILDDLKEKSAET